MEAAYANVAPRAPNEGNISSTIRHQRERLAGINNNLCALIQRLDPSPQPVDPKASLPTDIGTIEVALQNNQLLDLIENQLSWLDSRL